MIRVVLIDDQRDFRQITRLILSLYPDMQVVGEGANGFDALDLVEQERPDVVLMDVQMPLLDGVAATKRLHLAFPDVQILLLTSYDQDGYVQEGVRAGAAGYLPKNVRREQLITAIRTASQQRSSCAEYHEPAGHVARWPHR